MGARSQARQDGVAADLLTGAATAPPGAGVASRALARARPAAAVLAGIIIVTVALHVVWLVRFRHGYVTEWDESGYLQFALSNFDALHDEGLWGFAKIVGNRGTFGPLLPAVTALSYPIVGRGVFSSLLILPLFFAGLVCASFALARQLVSEWWAVLAALAVATIPAVTDYTRLFHFALPATACMTAALWALLRSDGLQRRRWVVAAGLFAALTLLSRTMTVAYIPAFALAAGALLLVDAPDLRARARNLAIGIGVVALIAGPWYLRNARSVYDNLVGVGYGEGATVYGRHHSIASWGYWTKVLQLDLSYLALPLAAVLLVVFCLALASLVVRKRYSLRLTRPRTMRAGAILALTLVVLEGYLVLTSSRNEGTAFSLPWLPALVILAVTALASIPTRPLRLCLAGALVVVSIGAAVSKSGWFEPLAKVRTVSVPGLGSVVVTDGRGVTQRELVGAGYDIPITQPPPAMHRRWLPLAREVDVWSLRWAKQHGQPLHQTLGFNDLIFGNSRLTLAAQLWLHRWLPVDYLHSFTAGDTVASYRRQLVDPLPVNALITADPGPRETITRTKVVAAARSLGFVPVKSFTMPDGRTIRIWWRGRQT